MADGEPIPGLRTLMIRLSDADDAASTEWARMRVLLNAVRDRGLLVDIVFRASERPLSLRVCANLELAADLVVADIPSLRFLSVTTGAHCSMVQVSNLLRCVVVTLTGLVGLEFVITNTDLSVDYCSLGFRYWINNPLHFRGLQYLSADWMMILLLMRRHADDWLPALHYLVIRKASPSHKYDVERPRTKSTFDVAYGKVFPRALAERIRTLAVVDGLSLTKQMTLSLVVQFTSLVSLALGVDWKEGSEVLRGDHTYIAKYFLRKLYAKTPSLRRLCIRGPAAGMTDAGGNPHSTPCWRSAEVYSAMRAIDPLGERIVWVHPNRPDGSSFAMQCEPALSTSTR